MQEQNKFKYIYNGKEVDREKFEELASDSFKWFDGDSIVSVPFSSFDNFFNGEFKSQKQINDRIKSILNIDSHPIVKDVSKSTLLNVSDCKFTMCGQKNCICCYPTKNTNSTRHKSQAGETHTENLVYVKEGTGYDYLKRMMKDDVITSSNRGEKETIEHLQGVKESQTIDKAPIFTYCKVNKNALEALALRALYGHNRYKKYDEDWQNFSRTPNGDFEYSNAQFRHALEIGGEETEEEHLVASAWNAVARLEIFLRNKLK